MGTATSKLSGMNKLAQVLPETTDVEATSPDGIRVIMKRLLSQTSMEDIDNLMLESASFRAVFRKNKLRVLRNLIAPAAWEDAIACVDRRLHMGKAARKAFDRDYEDGTVSQFPLDGISENHGSDGDDKPANAAPETPDKSRHPRPTDRGQWNLDDLCELVRVIDKLLGRKCSKTHPTFEEWEASWRSAHPRRDVHAYRAVPSRDRADWTNRDPSGVEHHYEELCRDHGTEDAVNFDYAFQRHTKFDPTGVRYEGIQMDKSTRARLQRAFFRLELIRRAYYQRPLFPQGAKFRSRTGTIREGEFGTAGETYATRLARAEGLFKGWAADDFREVVCAFKATLNEYAVPVSHMMEDFMVAVEDALESEGQRRVERVCEGMREGLRANAAAVGLRWERDPLTDEDDLRMWDVEPDEAFYDLRAQLLDEEEEVGVIEASKMVPLGRLGFDGLRSTIFRSERGRATPRSRREREDPSRRAPARETSPELAMSRFLHVLCSLPLGFLGGFMAMPASRKRRFLKSSYWALSRVKASHTPLFLSGEMSAWSSKPADGSGPRHWDLGKDARLFPELSVRAAAIACVCNVYECQTHPAMGFRVRVDRRDGGWRWRWNDRSVPPVVWARIRSDVEYRSVRIDGVFRMSPESWVAVWRSDREFERQLWTGPMAERERWEGYGHAGRLDPNECYCRLGANCALCLPLPDTELPEWGLFTKEELMEEIEQIKDLRNPELTHRYPELAESIEEYKKTHKAVLY
ncbi:hypothetical protein CT0861_01259 [Colletotrichum tofieldiae]|uniref:Uncharacterized protein n=1 Tax=Colletotrichum tofieldiae TaxID=708197 RepID=A0A161VLT9_9PEZI|nr:hypothetical protein CT0861_01259 [Colletotrichum tofieldiae]